MEIIIVANVVVSRVDVEVVIVIGVIIAHAKIVTIATEVVDDDVSVKLLLLK